MVEFTLGLDQRRQPSCLLSVRPASPYYGIACHLAHYANVSVAKQATDKRFNRLDRGGAQSIRPSATRSDSGSAKLQVPMRRNWDRSCAASAAGTLLARLASSA